MIIFAFLSRHSRLISSTKRMGVKDLWGGRYCRRTAAVAAAMVERGVDVVENLARPAGRVVFSEALRNHK